MRRMTKKELADIKRQYHIGDESGVIYARNLNVERMVAEIEASWRDRRRSKHARTDLTDQEKVKAAAWACRKCATFLACAAFDKNSSEYVAKMKGVTEGGVEKGDWVVTVTRTDV